MKKNMLSIATIMVLTLSFNGCGESSDNTEKSNEVKLDLAKYFPQTNETRNWITIIENKTDKTRNTKHYDEKIVRTDNVITYETNNSIHTKIEIKNDSIENYYPNEIVIEARYVPLGGKISSRTSNGEITISKGVNKKFETTTECILVKKLDKFVADSETYEDNLIEHKCTVIAKETFSNDANKTFTITDTYYSYYKKNKGAVAFIDRNCWVVDVDYNSATGRELYRLDDTSKSCDKETIESSLLLE